MSKQLAIPEFLIRTQTAKDGVIVFEFKNDIEIKDRLTFLNVEPSEKNKNERTD